MKWFGNSQPLFPHLCTFHRPQAARAEDRCLLGLVMCHVSSASLMISCVMFLIPVGFGLMMCVIHILTILLKAIESLNLYLKG